MVMETALQSNANKVLERKEDADFWQKSVEMRIFIVAFQSRYLDKLFPKTAFSLYMLVNLEPATNHVKHVL